jgi:hemolysin-activating ACP:hemolysin acyltransferase
MQSKVFFLARRARRAPTSQFEAVASQANPECGDRKCSIDLFSEFGHSQHARSRCLKIVFLSQILLHDWQEIAKTKHDRHDNGAGSFFVSLALIVVV